MLAIKRSYEPPSPTDGRRVQFARSPAERSAWSIERPEPGLVRVVADDNALVDREAAYRAGLGWYGKNTNLLLPGKGSWYLLGSVVTDAPLPAGRPMADGCGTCSRCLPACPTGAFIRPGVLDARRCLAWLVQAPGVFPAELRVALADRIYGGDSCQEVCPASTHATASAWSWHRACSARWWSRSRCGCAMKRR